MKLLLATTAAIVLLAGMAHAQERKPAEPRPNPYTIDQINRALESQGRPPLYSSRVLHEDNARTSRSTSSSTLTIRHD